MQPIAKFDEAQHPRNAQGRFVTLYHGTRQQHVEAIHREGLKPGKVGLVWATESREEAQRFAEGMDYPNPNPGAAVVELRVPKGAFFFEKPLTPGKKDPPGTRVARFVKGVPPEWVVKQEYKYGNTQIEIDSWSSAALSLNTARNLIHDEHLEGAGKDVDPNHITVRYGLINDDLDELRTFLASQTPFEVAVGGIELFPASEHSDGAVPVVARIYSPELHALEEVIGEYADFKHKSFPVYKPHCTIAYCKPDAAEQYASLPVGGTFRVHSVTISHASGVQETIPFGIANKWDSAKHPRDDQGQFAAVGSVKVGDREIEVVKPQRARRDTLIPVDVAKFEARWSGDTGFYLSEGGGKNAIGDRYARFGEFIAKNDSIEAAEVFFGSDGRVGFTNGRHRFAWLRDHGVTTIPVAVDRESLMYAKKFGYIAAQKWDESEHPRDKEGQFTEAGEQEELATFEDYEAAWAGGVGDFGDPEAGWLIQTHPEYYEYKDQLRQELEQKFGESFTVYRAVSQDAYEDMESGANLGPMSVTTDIEVAKNWVNFAHTALSGAELRILKTTVKPEIAVMRGKEEESEVVIDGDWVSFGDWEEIGRATAKGGFVAKKYDPAQPRDAKGRFVDLGLHGDTVTVLHGTTRQNAEAILKEGFKPGNPAAVAAQIEKEYNLPEGSIYGHVAFEFARGRRDLDEVHFTTDESVADQYSVPEVTQDALSAAYMLLHPMNEDEPFTKEKHLQRKAWIDRESKRLTEPALLAVSFPYEVAGQHAFGKQMTLEEFNKLTDRFDVEDSIFNNIRIPISALTLAKISRRKWDESAHPRDKEGKFRGKSTYEPNPDAPKEGEWDWTGVDRSDDPKVQLRNAYLGIGPKWKQQHLQLVADALQSWVGSPSSFRLHSDDAIAGAPIPDSGSGKHMRAQAEALLWELENKAIATPELYRGSGPKGDMPGSGYSWSEDRNVAKVFAKRYGGRVEILPAGARGLRLRDYAGDFFGEKQWIVRAGNNPVTIRKRQGRLWDSSKHPRNPAGSSRGGEFTETLHDAKDALNSLLNKEKNVNIDRDDVRRFIELAGEQHEDPDLTDLQVDGMEIFGGNGLGIPRDEMPQIPKEHRSSFLGYAKEQGIVIEDDAVDPLSLKPTQNQISARNVAEKLKKYEKGGRAFPPILVAQNGRILDGHHHWGMMAVYALDDPRAKVPVYRFKSNTKDMLAVMRAYMKKHGLKRKSISGVKQAWDEAQHPRDQKGKFTSVFGSLVEKASGVGYKSREKLVEMSITDFLGLADEGVSASKAAGVRAVLEGGKTWDSLPFLQYELRKGQASVVGHEGRHRAREMQSRGFTTMPVVLRGDIRWSEQEDPKAFDYQKEWPTELRSQRGTMVATIPFPVTREEAGQRYGAAKPVAITEELAGHKGMEMVSVKELEQFRTQDRRTEGKSSYNITEPTETLLPRLTKELREGVAIREPLTLSYDTEAGFALLMDGNTRLAAIADAGFTHAPVVISRSSLHGFGREVKKLTLEEAGITPYRNWLLPSEVGFSTLKKVKKADPQTGRYVTPFVSFDKQGDDMLRMIASLNSSRLATWGFTAEAEVRGIARYRVTAVLDGRTSEFCRMIDGKIFEVPDAREKVIEVLNVQNPEDLRQVQPWPKQTKAAIQEFREMSAEELTALGFHIPPYHPYCRTLLKAVESSAGELAEEETTDTIPEDVEMFQPVTMADLAELGIEATQENVDQWNAHIGMSPVELLSRLSGVPPQEVMTKGQGVGANPIQFEESGDIGIKASGEVAGVEFKLGALLDPFTGIYYLNYADLLTGTPGAEVKFLKRMFNELIGIGKASSAKALAVGVAGNAAYYAKLGFLPDDIEWDSIRYSALESLDTTLKPLMDSLSVEDQVLVRHLLQDQSVGALSALVDLPFTYSGRSIGEWILGDIGGTWALDLLDEALVAQAKGYLV